MDLDGKGSRQPLSIVQTPSVTELVLFTLIAQ
jgi:hypothetical protein